MSVPETDWRGWLDTAGIIALLLVLQGFGVGSFLSYLIVFAAYVGLKFWRDL